jgi:hypothetical protein
MPEVPKNEEAIVACEKDVAAHRHQLGRDWVFRMSIRLLVGSRSGQRLAIRFKRFEFRQWQIKTLPGKEKGT